MWELSANVSKDLETSDDLLKDSIKALTIEERPVTQPISKTRHLQSINLCYLHTNLFVSTVHGIICFFALSTLKEYIHICSLLKNEYKRFYT